MMKNFKTLELAIEFYQKGQKLKINNRIIKDQFDRASLSIALNIAEGYGRLTEKDRRRFYSISYGSLRETQCLLEIMNQEALLLSSDLLARYLYQLCRKPGAIFQKLQQI